MNRAKASRLRRVRATRRTSVLMQPQMLRQADFQAVAVPDRGDADLPERPVLRRRLKDSTRSVHHCLGVEEVGQQTVSTRLR